MMNIYTVFFTENQREKLRNEFGEKCEDKTFKKRYEACKGICIDQNFEIFYGKLVDNGTLCH